MQARENIPLNLMRLCNGPLIKLTANDVDQFFQELSMSMSMSMAMKQRRHCRRPRICHYRGDYSIFGDKTQ